MSICSEMDETMASMKTYQSLTDTELKSALEPEIKVLRIRELNLDDGTSSLDDGTSSLDDGTSSSYMFVDRDDAIEYLFDINLRKNIPVPISFNRYPYMVEMTFASSSEMKGSSETIVMIAEMVFDNWVDSTKLYHKT